MSHRCEACTDADDGTICRREAVAEATGWGIAPPLQVCLLHAREAYGDDARVEYYREEP
jgi:hypothetical protein